MKTSFIRQNVFPTLAAFIWGTAFVAQSVAADVVEPFTFNAARSIIAFVFLLCLALFLRKYRTGKGESFGHGAAYWRDLLIAGVCCGVALTVATNLQQKGLETTTAGKSGFITALYIVLVPLFGLFLHKKVSRTVWLSVMLAVVGLYFLCIKESLAVSFGDFLTVLCAISFAIHILVIDCFSQRVDGVELSCAQFLMMALISGAGMLLTESPSVEAVGQAMGSILYVGIFSSGVAYTLQILAQKGSNPTTVALLMSTEAVFATLAGALILHDQMAGREYFGCVIMLAAVVLAQLPEAFFQRLSCNSAGMRSSNSRTR